MPMKLGDKVVSHSSSCDSKSWTLQFCSVTSTSLILLISKKTRSPNQVGNLDHSKTCRHLGDSPSGLLSQNTADGAAYQHMLTSVLEAGKSVTKVPAASASGESLLPSRRQRLLAVSSRGRRGEGRSVESEGTNPIHEGSTLIKAPPKGPTSRYHHGWGLGFQHMNLGWDVKEGGIQHSSTLSTHKTQNYKTIGFVNFTDPCKIQ